MKTVICFDTEDERGMNDARKIMDHLVGEYLDKQSRRMYTVKFGKIEFIKLLRRYARMVESGERSSGLKDAKQFADEIFNQQNKGMNKYV